MLNVVFGNYCVLPHPRRLLAWFYLIPHFLPLIFGSPVFGLAVLYLVAVKLCGVAHGSFVIEIKAEKGSLHISPSASQFTL